jgi:hypothetical protein
MYQEPVTRLGLALLTVLAVACSGGSGDGGGDGDGGGGDDDGVGSGDGGGLPGGRDGGGGGGGPGGRDGGGGGGGGGETYDGCVSGANCVVTRIDGAEVMRNSVWFEHPFTRYEPADDYIEISYRNDSNEIIVNDFVGIPRPPGTFGCLGTEDPIRGVLFHAATPSTGRYVSTQCDAIPHDLVWNDETLTAFSITYEFVSTSPVQLGGSAHLEVLGGPGPDEGRTLSWDYTFHVCDDGGAMGQCD